MIRSAFVALLLSVSLALFALATWGKAEVNDPDRLAEQSSLALQSSQVRQLLAERITDEVWARVDVRKLLEDAIPADADFLVGPSEALSRAAVASAIDNLLRQDFAREIWQESVRITHQNALRALQNKQSALLIEEEVVAVDLRTVLRVTARKIGLPSVVSDNIPAGLGQLELARTKSVSEIRTAYQILDISPPLLLLLSLFLGVLLLAINHRAFWQGGLWAAGSAATAGVLVLLTKDIAPSLMLGSFSDPLAVSVGRVLWQEWSASIAASSSYLFILGAILLVVSFLASSWMSPWRKKAAEEVRRLAGELRAQIEKKD